MSVLRRLFDEIHRRSRWQVLGVYLAAGWAALQVADQFIQQLILPGWVYRSVLVLLLIGLPLILLTAFLQRGLQSPPAGGARALQRVFTWRNALLTGVGAFVVLLLGALGYVSSRALGVGPAATLIGRGVLAERERAVIADFAAGAQDSSLAAAVTEAIRIDLAQSPALSIVDRSEIADALARMQRPATSSITADLAREIAQRDGVKAVIAGALNRVGPGFVLTSDVLLAETGESIVSARETAADSSEIIAAIDRLSRRLRERIGESFYAVNGDPARAQRAAASRTSEPAWLDRHPWEMVPHAWVALADGQYERAAELWRRETEQGACPVCSMWLVGMAYDRASLPDSAIAFYERYLATPWLRKILVDAYARAYVLEHLAHLHDASGNREQAATYYRAFAELWADADPALQPRVRAARQRLTVLRAGGS